MTTHTLPGPTRGLTPWRASALLLGFHRRIVGTVVCFAAGSMVPLAVSNPSGSTRFYGALIIIWGLGCGLPMALRASFAEHLHQVHSTLPSSPRQLAITYLQLPIGFAVFALAFNWAIWWLVAPLDPADLVYAHWRHGVSLLVLLYFYTTGEIPEHEHTWLRSAFMAFVLLFLVLWAEPGWWALPFLVLLPIWFAILTFRHFEQRLIDGSFERSHDELAEITRP